MSFAASTLALLTIAAGDLRGDTRAACAGCDEHQRTPVVWEADGDACGSPPVVPQCMTLVDRSVQPRLHLRYAVPYDDVDVPDAEVADSRTHQFFASCRPNLPFDWPPNWISDADVAAAQAKDIIGDVDPDEVLEHASHWSSCLTRITADDERRPISCAAAEPGIDWDTTRVDAGVYTVEGYTYEPEFNVWWPRPGVVKVHDGDPDAVGPAAAVSSVTDQVYRDELIEFSGCVDAVDGTAVRVLWKPYDVSSPTGWRVVSPARAIEGDTFAFSFAPTTEMLGRAAMFALEFTDPGGRSYSTYPRDTVFVVDADHDDVADDSTSSDSGAAPPPGSSSESESGIEHGMLPEADPNAPRGCGCNEVPSPVSACWLLLLGFIRRRAVVSALIGASVSGCGPTVDGDGSDAAASSGGDTSSTSTTTTDSSSTSSSSSSSDTSSTGDPWTYPSGHNNSSTSCSPSGASLLVELYDDIVDTCLPPPDVSDGFVLLGIRDWDGNAGTFDVGPDGTGSAAIGFAASPEQSGSFTLEVDAPWSPSSVVFDVVVGALAAEGTADLSECFHSEPVDPCAE